MKRTLLVLSSLISSCFAMGRDCNDTEASAFDGASFFAGILYSSEKVESNVTEDVGFVTEQKIWNDWNAALASESFFGDIVSLTPEQKSRYVINANSVRDAMLKVKNAFTKTVYQVGADGEFNRNIVVLSDKTHVVANKAMIANGVHIKQSKTLKGFGGVLGAAYRFSPADLGDVVFGVSFEMNIRGKNKKSDNFGKFGVKSTEDKVFLNEDIGDEGDFETDLKAAAKDSSAYVEIPQSTSGNIGNIDGSSTAISGFPFNIIAFVQHDFSGDAIKKATGTVATIKDEVIVKTTAGDGTGTVIDDEFKNLLLVYHDGTTNVNREVKHGCIQPSLDFTAGYKFSEGQFLAEAFVGVTHVNTKVSYWNLSNQLVRKVKINKIAPSVGVNFGCAISENSYAGVKARYIFNTKKGTEKIKNNYQVSLYIAFNPKNAIAD